MLEFFIVIERVILDRLWYVTHAYIKRKYTGSASGKEPTDQCGRRKRCRFHLPCWEDPVEEGMATRSIILARKIL